MRHSEVGRLLGPWFLVPIVVFRSHLVPLEAFVMNLVSIGAAHGIAGAVFQLTVRRPALSP